MPTEQVTCKAWPEISTGAPTLSRKACKASLTRSGVLRLIEQENRKLIGPEPHHRVGGPHRLDHPPGDNLQQFVARRMAQAVVDQFEIVDVDQGHARPTVVALGKQHR